MRTILNKLLGLSFQRTPENVSSGHADFYQIFLHIKANVPLRIQPYIKKQKKKKYLYFAAKVSIPNFFDILHH